MISVIVPYLNESETVLQTLEMFHAQTLAPFEVILVDAGSSDTSARKIDQWIAEKQPLLKTSFKNIPAMSGYPSTTKNVGISHASGELLAFMDCGLIFPPHWLESHLALMNRENCEVVHTSGCFRGDDSLDRAAIAQTYGFGRARASVPGSLVKRSVFAKTGPFLEIRSGYDADWLRKLDRLGIRHLMNPETVIEYIGKSYTSGFGHLYRKTIIYTKPCVGLEGYYFPYLYLIVPLLLLYPIIHRPWLAIVFAALYLLLRGFVLPMIKSQRTDLFAVIPKAAFYLPATAVVIDVGKWVAYWQGLYLLIRSRFAGPSRKH